MNTWWERFQNVLLPLIWAAAFITLAIYFNLHSESNLKEVLASQNQQIHEYSEALQENNRILATQGYVSRPLAQNSPSKD